MSVTSLEPATTLEWSSVVARGADAESYLQGQLSQDLTTLGATGAWTLVLAPDSVVLGAAFVTRVSDGFDLVLERASLDVVHARLRRFLLRAACTLEVASVEQGPYATLGERVDDAWPGPAEFACALTPHAFGRRVVDATVSFAKGCFTGQELVGRLDARGASVPWRLARVTGPDPSSLDDLLRSKGPEGPSGLTSCYERDGVAVGLGVAHRTLFAAPLEDRRAQVTEVS